MLKIALSALLAFTFAVPALMIISAIWPPTFYYQSIVHCNKAKLLELHEMLGRDRIERAVGPREFGRYNRNIDGHWTSFDKKGPFSTDEVAKFEGVNSERFHRYVALLNDTSCYEVNNFGERTNDAAYFYPMDLVPRFPWAMIVPHPACHVFLDTRGIWYDPKNIGAQDRSTMVPPCWYMPNRGGW